MSKPYVYTVGHSNLELEQFIQLLQKHHIQLVADVRSIPYSTYTPQFNRETLATALQRSGICYIFLGKELGGDPDDPSFYYYNDKGEKVIDYESLAKTDAFKAGIRTILEEANRSRVALMCTEKDPLDCHRWSLLVQLGGLDKAAEVLHILDDGRLETHEATLQRLPEKLHGKQCNSNSEQAYQAIMFLDEIIDLQIRRVARSRGQKSKRRSKGGIL
ncbi:MAG: DUF488 domain-containing protein [Thermorudis peleae]|nr:DUF488 domain-containing protein [Thermorudis peleae]